MRSWFFSSVRPLRTDVENVGESYVLGLPYGRRSFTVRPFCDAWFCNIARIFRMVAVPCKGERDFLQFNSNPILT